MTGKQSKWSKLVNNFSETPKMSLKFLLIVVARIMVVLLLVLMPMQQQQHDADAGIADAMVLTTDLLKPFVLKTTAMIRRLETMVNIITARTSTLEGDRRGENNEEEDEGEDEDEDGSIEEVRS